MRTSCPPYTTALLRHFVDLRDSSHHGVTARSGKERLFTTAVALVDPHARQTLEEINTSLLLGTGEVTATGVRRSPDGGVDAILCVPAALDPSGRHSRHRITGGRR